MPTFRFQAKDEQGQRQQGELVATTSAQALTELRARGWLILDLQAAAVPGAGLRSMASALQLSSLLPATKFDVEVGFLQMVAMLRSGLTLLTSLKTVEEQARRPAMARIWREVYERIQDGASFTDALRDHPRHFDNFVVQLVQVGDESGALETVLTRAAEHLERSRNLRTILINALIYPVIVFLFALGVTTFMLVGIIPQMEKVLRSRGHHLPAMTQTLLDVSAFVRIHGWEILIMAALLVAAGILLYRTERGRMGVDRIFLSIPLLGKVLRVAGTAVLARSLGLLLQNGINLIDALRTSKLLLSNVVQRQRLETAREGILQGASLAHGLEVQPGFEPMLPRMVTVAEATGRLDTVLAEVARFHEAQLATLVRRLGALVEPAVILVVGGIVGFVYIAFFMALMSLTGGAR
jgi:type IV pilus assembly protein PilC